MKVLLLGTTGYHPNERRHTACFMLPEQGIVLDAGSGMFRVAKHLQTERLDIFLSHTHLDHIVGLTFLFDVLADQDISEVTVHAAADKIEAIETHLLAAPIFPVKLPCEMKTLGGTVRLRDGGLLTSFPLVHPGGSIGFRLDWPGHSMAYVTDTTADPTSDYVEAIRGVDLLIHECYFPDGHEDFARQTGHSCAAPVAQVAQSAGVGRLILVHMDPRDESDDPIGIDGVRLIFPRAEIGEDRMELEF